MSSLFAELKRRKVVRVAVVYAATAFAVQATIDGRAGSSSAQIPWAASNPSMRGMARSIRTTS